MKTKTIKLVLRKQIDAWVESIEDPLVQALAKDNTIVTGGCIASMLLREKVNDFDLYFRTYEAALAVARYYVTKFEIKKKTGIHCKISVTDGDGGDPKETGTSEDRIKIVIKSSGIASDDGTDKPYEYFESSAEGAGGDYAHEVMTKGEDIEDAFETTKEDARKGGADEIADNGRPPFHPIFLSSNAITLSNRIQLILRFHGSPDEIHSNYDFQHCMNYWTSWDGALVLRPEALEALLTKELRYVGSKYPICSLIRLRKFIKRDWTINAGQILKIAMQVAKLDLTDHKVLEDQLTGVDVAYFVELVNKLKEKDPTKVNSAYLIEIIDRMF